VSLSWGWGASASSFVHHCAKLWSGGRSWSWLLLFHTSVKAASLLATAAWCSWWSISARSKAAGPAGGRSKRWPAPPPNSALWLDLWWIRSARQKGWQLNEVLQMACVSRCDRMQHEPGLMWTDASHLIFPGYVFIKVFQLLIMNAKTCCFKSGTKLFLDE